MCACVASTQFAWSSIYLPLIFHCNSHEQEAEKKITVVYSENPLHVRQMNEFADGAEGHEETN